MDKSQAGLRHLVALRFRDSVSEAEKQALYGALRALLDRLDGALDFQVRSNVSVENELVRGYRDLFWFDFRDSHARDAYLVDPEHQAVGARLVEHLEGGIDGVFVIDFDL